MSEQQKPSPEDAKEVNDELQKQVKKEHEEGKPSPVGGEGAESGRQGADTSGNF